MDRDEHVRWKPLTELTIDVTDDGLHWNAGRIVDVLVPINSDVILAGSETGGVWEINRSSGEAVPLSNDWDHPDVLCLAQGIWKDQHIYAGCAGGLYETGFVAGQPFRVWRDIPLPANVTGVKAIAVDRTTNRIIIGTDLGVFWAPASFPYVWRPAIQTPFGAPMIDDTSGVTVGFQAVIASPETGSVLYVGRWNPAAPVNLEFSSLRIPPYAGLSSFSHMTVATASGTPNVIYAGAHYRDGRIAGVLRTTDDGATWDWCGDFIPSLTSSLSVAGGDATNGGRLKRVHCSKTGKAVSCCGLKGFISEDMGGTWRVIEGPVPDVPHVDVHAVLFDPNDASNERLILATDGGVFVAEGLARDRDKVSGALNRYLNTLQCMSHGPTRGFWGTITAGNTVQRGPMVFSAQQDNGIIKTSSNGGERWKRVHGGDGGFLGMLPAGTLIFAIVPDQAPAKFSLEARDWRDANPITIEDRGRPGLLSPNAQILARPWRAPLGAPRPEWVYGVAAVEGDDGVYALIGIEALPALRWEKITTLPLGNDRVSAIDGEEGIIYVGTNTGRLFAVALQGFPPNHSATVHEFNIALSPGHVRGAWNRIAFQPAGGRWAIMQTGSNGGSLVFLQQSLVWKDVTNNLADVGPATGLAPLLFGLCVTRDAAFVASDSRVFRSLDEGASWADISGNLPRRFHGSDLTIAPRTNTESLLLATFGRGAWTTSLS